MNNIKDKFYRRVNQHTVDRIRSTVAFKTSVTYWTYAHMELWQVIEDQVFLNGVFL